METTMKRCKHCETTDPLAFYASQKTLCKSCHDLASKARRMEDPTKHAARSMKWAKKNPASVNAKAAKYRATQLQQTPSWSETEEIKELYSWAAHLQKVTGIPMHVDHIVPQQGKNVRGFHCIANLKVITAAENLSKGNRHESD